MKKLIVMAVALLVTACITAFASEKKPVVLPKKQVNYHLSFTKIVVMDDIDLQLTESNARIIDITGNNEKVMEKLDWKIKDEVLYIKSKSGSLKHQVKVSLHVDQLRELHVIGKSVVRSAGALLSPSLYIYMEGEGYVSVKNTGDIYIVNGTNTEVEVKKLVGNVRIS